MGDFFEPIARPVLDFLILLSQGLFNNFGLGIIAFTIITRLVLLPLTVKQLRSSKAMSEKMRALHPKIEALKKKYAKDKQKLAQETMNAYKEAGISPLGCLTSPMLITMVLQMPIFLAVYWAINLGLKPEGDAPTLLTTIAPELSDKFLWLNLGEGDPYYILPLLVIGLMWVSQKMITIPTGDPNQQQMTKMMQIIMPLMFGFICITIGLSGVVLYWATQTAIGIAIQYPIYGWNRAPSTPTIERGTVKGPTNPTEDEGEVFAAQQTSQEQHQAKPRKPRKKDKKNRKYDRVVTTTQIPGKATIDSSKHKPDITVAGQTSEQEERLEHG